MKILVDAHVFDGKYQGSRTYIQGLYTELIRLKPEWQFYFAARDVVELRKCFGDYKNVTYMQLKHKNKYFRLLFELPGLVRKHKIDYTHFQYITPLFKTKRFIVTTHDILFEEKRFSQYFSRKTRLINGKLFKRSARMADVLLTVSEYSKAKLTEYYKISSEKIYITPNGVNQPEEQIQPSKYIQDKFGCRNYLLYVSRIEPRKNHLGVLKAFVQLKLHKEDHEVVFVGSRDTDHPELDAYLREHNEILGSRVHFHSNIQWEDLQQFYANAELIVYPSFAEGFGIPPLEAAMYHKNVVCSNCTAMAEFDFFKYHIDPYDQNAITEAISEGIATKDANYLKRTANLVSERYTWENAAKAFIRAMKDQI